MKHLHTLFIIAAVCLLASCGRGNSLVVMSYNVRNAGAADGPNEWNLRKSATPAMIEAVKPDVFGVQEALPEQEEYILQTSPDYKCYGIGRTDGVNGERMSVFYNTKRLSMEDCGTWWLSETPDVPSVGWDAKYPRTATWALLKDLKSGHSFYFVNTHLDHKGVVARKEGLAMIVSKIREMNPDVPLILTGDFNVEPSDSCLIDLDRMMLSARATARATVDTPSFNGFKKPASKTIDYIYYNGFASAAWFKVVDDTFDGKEFISDHYPIAAKLVY